MLHYHFLIGFKFNVIYCTYLFFLSFPFKKHLVVNGVVLDKRGRGGGPQGGGGGRARDGGGERRRSRGHGATRADVLPVKPGAAPRVGEGAPSLRSGAVRKGAVVIRAVSITGVVSSRRTGAFKTAILKKLYDVQAAKGYQVVSITHKKIWLHVGTWLELRNLVGIAIF